MPIGHAKGKVWLWMRVTADKYSLPIVTADTARELAKKCGVLPNTIHHHINLHKRGVLGSYPLYIRVVLEEECDGQDSYSQTADGQDTADV